MTTTTLPAGDLIDGVLGHAKVAANRTALHGAAGDRLTYGDLADQIRCGAAGLRAAGMQVGDGVLFAVRPSPRAVVAALSVVAAGGVVIVADPGAGPALASARLEVARPRWTMAEPAVHLMSRRPVRRLLARRGLALPDLAAPGLRHIVVGGGRLSLVAPRGAVRWESLQHKGSRLASEWSLDPSRPALVVFTSGTTAAPRAVQHSVASLTCGVRALLERLALRTDDVVHTDQMMIGLPVLAAGATWSLAPVGACGATWRRTAVARRATVGYAVPATLDAAARDGALPGSLRLIATGGAPVTPAVVARLAAAAPRARVVGVYGLTEALPVATVEGPDVLQHSASPGAGVLLGTPVPGTRVGVDEAGELWVSGPQVATCYLGEPPLHRVLTGDQGRLLPNGDLELLGRGKDMLLRGVTNIYPALVEPLVEAEPLVAEAAMVGVADHSTGDERVVLVVAPTSGTTAAQVRSVLRRRLPELLDAAWLPDDVVVVPALPRSGRAGKVDKVALRTGLADGRLAVR